MAVFTPITQAQLQPWLAQFDLGTIIDLVGIPSGIENSNFFLTTLHNNQHHTYVLTLFERLSSDQLPFYLCFMRHLADHGVLVAAPVPDRNQQLFSELQGKPAAIVNKLEGRSIVHPQLTHCQQVGEMLARMHLAGRDYSRYQANLRSLSWWQETIPIVQPYVSASLSMVLNQELLFQQQFFATAEYAQLPEGAAHCDLFRNNVLFVESDGQDRLSGFFDFYFAACDKWLFDLAVTVNDWCVEAGGGLNAARTQALLHAYHRVRPLTAGEAHSWKKMLRAAALRFWVSRLWDFYLPRTATMLTPLDPSHFENILRLRIEVDHPPWID